MKNKKYNYVLLEDKKQNNTDSKRKKESVLVRIRPKAHKYLKKIAKERKLSITHIGSNIILKHEKNSPANYE